MPQHKYGRIAPAPHVLAALPQFAALAAASLPAPRKQVILTQAQATPTYAGMLGNQIAGDCTLAGVLRVQQGLSAQAQPVALQFTDAQGLADYTVMTGYDPATGQPDPGCVETDVLDYWKSTGFQGNKIDGYMSVDPKNVGHIKQSIDTFGSCYFGLNLPKNADEAPPGAVWSVDPFSPIVGGHCIVGFEYDEYYVYCGTWADRKPVTWDFAAYYFNAAYAVVDRLWLEAAGKSPGGLDLATLLADLAAVAN
jgi:hypothetical protein